MLKNNEINFLNPNFINYNGIYNYTLGGIIHFNFVKFQHLNLQFVKSWVILTRCIKTLIKDSYFIKFPHLISLIYFNSFVKNC